MKVKKVSGIYNWNNIIDTRKETASHNFEKKEKLEKEKAFKEVLKVELNKKEQKERKTMHKTDTVEISSEYRRYKEER